jgi:hypothetical protein
MKTKTEHTPGPWKVSQCFKLIERDSVLGTPIATLNPAGAICQDENEANARLIALATDMERLLRLAQVRLFMIDGSSDLYQQIGTALD